MNQFFSSDRGIPRAGPVIDRRQNDRRALDRRSGDRRAGDRRNGESLAEARLRRVRAAIGARRLRDKTFPFDLSGDVCWTILLDMYLSHLEQRADSISSVGIASGAPSTTALRHIRQLTDRGLIERYADPDDGRRVLIRLTGEAATMMDRVFDGCDERRPYIL